QELGYYRSQIHGWFDRPTQAALIRFQKDSGLFGTGRVDRSTRSALRQGNRQAAAPVPQIATGLRRGDGLLSDNFSIRSEVWAKTPAR
ncbi:peptidoglycan-binding domain-containing protein, partial [Microcoleus sp. Pol12B4]|uniref:peptidoglycan-binding domain-containing protein n=1 Tax=Microcoleus sp. Pol12B4 TaxID=3055395 RepID=UPI002FCFF19C